MTKKLAVMKKPVAKKVPAKVTPQPLRVAVDRMSIQPPLRDVFAAFALGGLLAGGAKGLNKQLCDVSWAVADKMLETRGNGHASGTDSEKSPG